MAAPHSAVHLKVSVYGVVPQWQRAQRFFSTPSECLHGSGSFLGVLLDDIAWQTSTHGRLGRQSWTTAAGSVIQSSSTWKYNRTISKTIDRITGALHTSTRMTSKQTKYSWVTLKRATAESPRGTLKRRMKVINSIFMHFMYDFLPFCVGSSIIRFGYVLPFTRFSDRYSTPES